MKSPIIFLVLTTLLCLSSCKNGKQTEEKKAEDSIASKPVEVPALPDTSYASIEALTFVVDHVDSVDKPLKSFTDLYANNSNVMTFRKNLMRNADFGGTITGTPTKVEVAWVFNTENDQRPTKLGTWGGGSGWTGQPLYMHWTPSDIQAIKSSNKQLTEDFNGEEIMIGSLCTKVYFLNFQNGKPSRNPVDVKNVVKGTMSLDPELKNLYVGQGVPHVQPFGTMCIDLLTDSTRQIIDATGKAWRGWNGFDSSSIVAGGFLFWAGENGNVYKFEREQGNLRLVSTMRYKVKGMAPGIESSICVYRNYGFCSDNNGNILCINLNTMNPVWYYDNHDDSDGTIVCREEGGTPYLYCGCEVDKQGDMADCHLIKLNALNGQLVWEAPIPCKRLTIGKKTFDGGMYATPLLGAGDCEGIIFYNITRNKAGDNPGELHALNTKDGSEVYRVGYETWAWSSPVAFYNERKEMYIFTGDAIGNVYLIRGKTGEVIYKEKVANNFESSPVVVGNSAVVGSRGNGIYKFVIK